ncbi:MAG TPA: prephenate dehydrogenase/arogenate dehydrogenase family protein [Acidimicrobiales bacterium]|nr:prephenate dehydrogenase/arogenate dehydrogenase family protein [Acidimicrobiales bacterium]
MTSPSEPACAPVAGAPVAGAPVADARGSGSGAAPGRALVVGTGLIGGSLGLALRARGWEVHGYDADPARTDVALAQGALDDAGDDLDAEVAFVATPASAVSGVARALLEDPGRRPDLVVTDVSGVKAAVVAAVGHPRFVGGHPMAGSEQVGLDGADAELFVGSLWVLTTTPDTDLAAFSKVRGVVSSLGADVVALSPSDHDRLVAVVSHVPHLVAATLMNAASDAAAQDAVLLRLAAGGFRDMTRVAAGSPGIWPDVCAENSPAIAATLDRVIADLGAMRDRVLATDRDGVFGVLERASRARRHLPARGARPERLTEVRVPVPDREGVLAELTSVAGDLGINIYDIEIAHSAEGPRGVLLLVVDAGDAGKLRDAVAARGYRATAQAIS